MPAPVYFLPNVPQSQVVEQTRAEVNRATLAAHGLLTIFGDLRKEDLSVTDCRFKHGSGCLLAYGAPDYFTRPDSLTWLEGPVWLGYDPDQPPTEKDLRRKRTIPGYPVDGWEVPIIRRPDDSTELPRDMYFDGGTLREPILEAYREFWEESAEVVKWCFNDSGEFGGQGFTKAKAFDLAVRALSINYRLGHQEQRIARAVNSENFVVILTFTVDYPRFYAVREASKKNLLPPITPNTTPGQGESSPATDPAGQTSG